jgi:hypothetical protein
MDNQEKLVTLGTQDIGRRQKTKKTKQNTTQHNTENQNGPHQ